MCNLKHHISDPFCIWRMLLLMPLIVVWKELLNTGFERLNTYAGSPETLGCHVHKLIPMLLAFLTPCFFFIFPLSSYSPTGQCNCCQKQTNDLTFQKAYFSPLRYWKRKIYHVIRITKFLNNLKQL